MRVPKPEYLAIGKRLVELREGRKFNQIQGAVALGIKNRTYQNYEYGFNQPNTGNLKKVVDYYGCSYLWLLTGEGYKYPKAVIPAPSEGHAYIKEATDLYALAKEGLIHPASSAPAQDFSVAEDLILAKSVLESRTHYATALHLNIRSFVAGVSSETTISKCQDDIHTQGELIAQLQARLDERDKQDKKLREEIKELKRTSGDSPPTALGTDHAALTGTGDQEA